MAVVLTILAFLWWWPLGLVLLGFLMARGRFGCRRHLAYAGDGEMFDREHGGDRWERKMARMQDKVERIRARMESVRSRGDWFCPASSGNRAFDDYRAETLRRLEEEQREFKDFLARLRFAKDRAEFDQFMAERRQRPVDPGPQAEPH
jgi:erythromycin esterase-like protein